MRLLALLVAIAAPSACGLADRPELPPEGQVVLYVTTDAVLPAPPSETNGTAGLFDRLSIEIFPPGESTPCAGCARQFSIDSRSVDEGRTSMGYVPRPGTSGTRARVRIYRTLGAEIVEAFLARSDAVDTVVHSYITRLDDAARSEATVETFQPDS